jgi:hypothetical protein
MGLSLAVDTQPSGSLAWRDFVAFLSNLRKNFGVATW